MHIDNHVKVGHKGPRNVPGSTKCLCLLTEGGVRKLSAKKVGNRSAADIVEKTVLDERRDNHVGLCRSLVGFGTETGQNEHS